jgi:hypothetical protein
MDPFSNTNAPSPTTTAAAGGYYAPHAGVSHAGVSHAGVSPTQVRPNTMPSGYPTVGVAQYPPVAQTGAVRVLPHMVDPMGRVLVEYVDPSTMRTVQRFVSRTQVGELEEALRRRQQPRRPQPPAPQPQPAHAAWAASSPPSTVAAAVPAPLPVQPADSGSTVGYSPLGVSSSPQPPPSGGVPSASASVDCRS